MQHGWKEVKWGELAELEYGKALKKDDRMSGAIPVFGTNGQIDWHDTALAEGPGIVIGRKGAYRGVEYCDSDFWVIDTAFWLKPKSDVALDLYWASYQLKNFDINNLDSGSALPSTSREAFAWIPVLLPPLEVQTRIGQLLKAFDDLIENNRRRIQLLEETARLIYREWFVHFRYPGHEDVLLVDSELGPIPEGWEVCPVEEVMGVVGGGTPSKKEEDYWIDGDIQWYTPSDLTGADSMFALESGLRINQLGLAKSSAKLFSAGSVMMTSRATIGVLSFATTEACTNQGFITCCPSGRLGASYIYFWLEAGVPLFLQISSGSTFKELTRSTFKKLRIAVPPAPLENEFCSLVEPLLQSVLNLLRQQRVLTSSRDLLLPRLVSGDLDISNLDLDLEAVS